MNNTHCTELEERFGTMASNGLLDVKFFVRNAQEATPDQLCEEVTRLYAAVDRGEVTPLDFKDSSRPSA